MVYLIEKIKQSPLSKNYSKMLPYVKPYWKRALLAVLITILDQEASFPADCLLQIHNNSPATFRIFLVQFCYRLYKYLPYHAPIRRRSYE